MTLRNPRAVRPWQHVLNPLAGYLLLAQALVEKGTSFSGAWNFGPVASDCQPVMAVANQMAQAWGDGAEIQIEKTSQIFEEKFLSLDSSKAHAELGWSPKLPLLNGILALVNWYKAQTKNADMWAFTQA